MLQNMIYIQNKKLFIIQFLKKSIFYLISLYFDIYVKYFFYFNLIY